MEYVVTALAVAAFGYFIYTRVKASRSIPRSGGGSGGGGNDGGQTHHK